MVYIYLSWAIQAPITNPYSGRPKYHMIPTTTRNIFHAFALKLKRLYIPSKKAVKNAITTRIKNIKNQNISFNLYTNIRKIFEMANPTMGFFFPYGPFTYLSIDINSTEKTIFYP